jgi:serine/threonine-protein kinase Chk2
LCGFPPFSDELYSPENPYTLSQQIKLGRFDYPSPYWDSVGDPALDPWTTQGGNINPADSTDGLTGAIANLDFSRRKIQRERTLLSSINEIKVARVIPTGEGQEPLKVYEKNGTQKGGSKMLKQKDIIEERPADKRDPREFAEMGGKGDQTLFDDV